MARIFGIIVCLVVLVGAMQAVVGTASADDAQNVGAYRQFIDAINRGNAAEALGLFTDDAQLSGVPPFCVPSSCSGKAAIQKQLEFEVSSHIQLQLLGSVNVVNGNVTALVAHRGDPIRAAGVSRVEVTDTVSFRGDGIAKFIVDPVASDPQTATFLRFVASQSAGSGQPLAMLHQQQLDALNRGDLAGVMAFFADNATVAIAGCSTTPCVGKAAVQQEVERQIAMHDRVRILSATVSGSTLTELTQISGDPFTAAGIQRIQFVEVTQFSGDKVAAVTGQLDLTDPQTVAFLRAQAAQITPPNTGDGGLK